MSATFWVVFLSALAVGFSTKKTDYEEALDKALKYAVIRDVFKPLDMQEYRDGLRITKVLYSPPYAKYARRLHTAKPGKPVELRYMFQATTDPDIPTHTKGWLCTATINEFQIDRKFYYILPYRKNMICEEHPENEGNEEVTAGEPSSFADGQVNKAQHQSWVTVPSQSPSPPSKVTTPETANTTTGKREIPPSVVLKNSQTTKFSEDKNDVPEPKKYAMPRDKITSWPTKPTPMTVSEATKSSTVLYRESEKSNEPDPPKNVPDTTKNPFKVKGNFAPEYVIDEGGLTWRHNKAKNPNETRERSLRAEPDSEAGATLSKMPEPPKDNVVQYKFHEATVNLDLSRVEGQRAATLLPLHSIGYEELENAVINITFTKTVANQNDQNPKIYGPHDVLELKSPQQHEIKEPETVLTSNLELNSPLPKMKEPQYSMHIPSINLGKARMKDGVPEILPHPRKPSDQRSLLTGIKQRKNGK